MTGGGVVWGLFEGTEGNALLRALVWEAAVAVTGCLGVAILLAIMAGGTMGAPLLWLALNYAAPIFLIAASGRVIWHCCRGGVNKRRG